MASDLDTFPPIEPELLIATLGPGGEPLHRNDPWIRILGEDAEWTRFNPEDRERARQFVREAASGSLVTMQVFLARVRGQADDVPILLHFLPLHTVDAGGTKRVQAVAVTGEVLREPDTWAQSQTQRDRLENLGRMTMGIAHDFNNLLSGILGYTELLKSGVENNQLEPEALSEHLRTIEQAALDGAALIRKIQQYIRQEKQTHFTPLDLTSLIQDCVALTRPYWYNEPRRKGISIEVQEKFEDTPPVLGSATELREVLLNLILNAVQAMPEGGILTIRTDTVEEGVRLQFSDTGVGMSEDVQNRIFEPLYTTKGEGGTGMGLSVTYGIIQEHEGSIRVQSRLGEGTLFEIILPRAGEARPVRSEAVPETRRASARILIVDDEDMVRNILAKLLTLKGHTVTSAASGKEALVIARKQAFDIIFTDHGMPEMNGRELAVALREQFPDVPIVLLTGDTNVGEPGDDIDIVLGKPFKIDELEGTIQDLLRSGRPNTP